MRRLILILQFLTRIPLPTIEWRSDNNEFRDGIVYFPLVGFIVGLFIMLFYFLGNLLGGKLLASVAAVTSEAFITGGLHIDGLADTFDGLYSNRSKDRILEIMKDSRIGTNGVLAILLTILLKLSLIYQLPESETFKILLLMPVFSRLGMVFASRYSKYARENGLGNVFIGQVNNKHVAGAVLISGLISLIHISSLLFIPIVFGFCLLYIKNIKEKIGGMTGDTLGALCELSELVYLVFYSMVLYIGRLCY